MFWHDIQFEEYGVSTKMNGDGGTSMDGCLWTKGAKQTLDEWMLGGWTLDAMATMLQSVREFCSDGE